MCKWLGVKSHEFQARWALGDGAAKGSPGRAAGICGLPVALQTRGADPLVPLQEPLAFHCCLC